MIAKKKVKGKNEVKVTFSLPEGDYAEKPSLVGDFNNWDPGANVLIRRNNRTYSTSVVLESGQRYSFRYRLDEETWIDDEMADEYEPNPFGGQNGIVLT